MRPGEVYHVTVLSCYDKKLEASGEDFVFETECDCATLPSQKDTCVKVTEVGSVLKSGEGFELLQVLVANPFDNPVVIVKGLYNKWLVQPDSERAKKYIHKQYHPIAKSITSELHNW